MRVLAFHSIHSVHGTQQVNRLYGLEQNELFLIYTQASIVFQLNQ